MYDYNDALSLILDNVSSSPMLADGIGRDGRLSPAAIELYGLIHARFILTSRGQEKMRDKFLAGDYGTCPRLNCMNQKVLPVGLYDKLGEDGVKIYCPKCKQVFNPPMTLVSNVIDGSFIGTSFPHYLAMGYEIPIEATKAGVREEVPVTDYVPKVFGFRIFNPDSPRHKNRKLSKVLTPAAPTVSVQSNGETDSLPSADVGTISLKDEASKSSLKRRRDP